MKKTGNLAEALKKYAQSGRVLRVGIFEDATYPANDSGEVLHVAQVAFWNEYGAKVEVPEHKVTIYRSINEKTGDFRRDGRFTKKAKANFETTHTVPAHTITIPSRPFFRKTVRDNRKQWIDKVGQLLSLYKGDVDKVLNVLGNSMSEEIRAAIMSWTDPPNRPSTVRKKGFNSPLRESGDMAKAIGYEVSDDES